MARFRLHPFTAVTCVTVTSALFLLTGMQAASGGPTPEQLEILSYLTLEKLPDGEGGRRLTVRLTGANFQVVNGLGDTSTENGTGNLIVGYDETGFETVKTGSHTLVVGRGHSYTSHGGAVFGVQNKVLAPFAAVTGGQFNQARAFCAAVSGGTTNEATGEHASVSGGNGNLASGASASVGGGRTNLAEGVESAILGGEGNYCAAQWSTVAGGSANRAVGVRSSVSGDCFLENPNDCTVIP